jgi:hypothetical protein
MDPILLKPPWIRPILARSRKGGALFCSGIKQKTPLGVKKEGFFVFGRSDFFSIVALKFRQIIAVAAIR